MQYAYCPLQYACCDRSYTASNTCFVRCCQGMKFACTCTKFVQQHLCMYMHISPLSQNRDWQNAPDSVSSPEYIFSPDFGNCTDSYVVIQSDIRSTYVLIRSIYVPYDNQDLCTYLMIIILRRDSTSFDKIDRFSALRL